MYCIVQNNEIVKTGGSIRTLFPNISFPAGGASAQFKADHGVMEVVDGEQKDQRFYWVTPANPYLQLVDGVPTFVFTNTPKELEDREESDQDGNPLYVKVFNQETEQMEDTAQRLITKGLKSQFIAQAKDSANKALAATDWYVIRKAERGTDIPAEVVADRAAIVQACTDKEAAITAATTIEQLMEAVK